MSTDQKKAQKAFDITPPSAQNSQAVVTAPKVLVKKDPMLTFAPVQDSSSIKESEQVFENPAPTEQAITSASTGEKTVQPISEEFKAESQDTNPILEEKNEEPEEAFVSTDALPDVPSSNDLNNAEKSESMQKPKIYDTNEYFVPIHETSHSHGFVKGSLVAGFIAALSVLTVVAVIAFQVNK